MVAGPVTASFVAGILACLACGLGALPLFIRRLDLERNVGLGYAFAGGMMLAASVFNLLEPAVSRRDAVTIVSLLAGIWLGCFFIHQTDRYMTRTGVDHTAFSGIGSQRLALIFITMLLHSLPEGFAVGVGYGSASEGLGTRVALAIAMHNIPEGLAIAIPCRAEGGSILKAFWLATLSSATQPLAAVPAALMVQIARPLLVPSLGFAAGAMIYLVLLDLIPAALGGSSPGRFAATFMGGFGLMLLVQVIL